jgi:hypothetical protein
MKNKGNTLMLATNPQRGDGMPRDIAAQYLMTCWPHLGGKPMKRVASQPRPGEFVFDHDQLFWKFSSNDSIQAITWMPRKQAA